MAMIGYLLVALGGALGAAARYGVGELGLRFGWGGFPWATLIVNVAGGLAMGVLAGLVAQGGGALRLFAGVGVLGGFTTFSAFSLDALRLIEAGETAASLAYVAASVAFSIGACWFGLTLVRTGA
jgi:CrcB protein